MVRVMNQWTCVLELASDRRIAKGSAAALADGIRRGADLRIGTEFIHNEHIDVASSNPEPILEVAEFGVTYLVEDRWSAGIMSLRQPVELPTGFGARPSLSFFLYNQDGSQSIARPHLDGLPASGAIGRSPDQPPANMPKYHVLDSWDQGTNAPSHNFIYDFGFFRYFLRDRWEPVLHHDADGGVLSGSVAALAEAFAGGCSVKAGIAGVCAGLGGEAGAPRHDLFVEVGSCYYYREQKLFIAGTHPMIRVAPGAPLRYRSRGWDFGWLVLRTDGRNVYRRCDPYTLAFEDLPMRNEIRWFVG
jgi:hypothetical protein